MSAQTKSVGNARGDTVLLPPEMRVQGVGRTFEIFCSGTWSTRTAKAADRAVRNVEADGLESAMLDMGDVQMLDTAGAHLIDRMIIRLEAAGAKVSLKNVSDADATLLDAVHEANLRISQDDAPVEQVNGFVRPLETVGKLVYSLRRDLLMSLHILGAAIAGSQMKDGHSSRFVWAPLIAQIDKTGVQAIPIVVLMATIIGAIIAQQGAFQLRYFGAEIFVVDLVSILVLREIGVLITAIMVAGRSGSAITAEIGSMRMREEVDALTVIGLNPVAVLVFPRMIALMVALPLLTFLANIAALGGAMVVADLYSGISFNSFIARLQASVDLTSLFSGLIKAPFMAVIIGVIASVEGMKVGGSAESLGRHVTASVVKAIFVVIVVDGIFAIFFAAIDF